MRRYGHSTASLCHSWINWDQLLRQECLWRDSGPPHLKMTVDLFFSRLIISRKRYKLPYMSTLLSWILLNDTNMIPKIFSKSVALSGTLRCIYTGKAHGIGILLLLVSLDEVVNNPSLHEQSCCCLAEREKH